MFVESTTIRALDGSVLRCGDVVEVKNDHSDSRRCFVKIISIDLCPDGSEYKWLLNVGNSSHRIDPCHVLRLVKRSKTPGASSSSSSNSSNSNNAPKDTATSDLILLHNRYLIFKILNALPIVHLGISMGVCKQWKISAETPVLWSKCFGDAAVTDWKLVPRKFSRQCVMAIGKCATRSGGLSKMSGSCRISGKVTTICHLGEDNMALGLDNGGIQLFDSIKWKTGITLGKHGAGVDEMVACRCRDKTWIVSASSKNGEIRAWKLVDDSRGENEVQTWKLKKSVNGNVQGMCSFNQGLVAMWFGSNGLPLEIWDFRHEIPNKMKLPDLFVSSACAQDDELYILDGNGGIKTCKVTQVGAVGIEQEEEFPIFQGSTVLSIEAAGANRIACFTSIGDVNIVEKRHGRWSLAMKLCSSLKRRTLPMLPSSTLIKAAMTVVTDAENTAVTAISCNGTVQGWDQTTNNHWNFNLYRPSKSVFKALAHPLLPKIMAVTHERDVWILCMKTGKILNHIVEEHPITMIGATLTGFAWTQHGGITLTRLS